MRVRGGGLLGRAEDLSRLRRLLAQSRLVTVTGAAGVGKSVLAAHAAAAVSSQLPDGVIVVRWWDDGLARGQSVARAVAEAMDGEAGEVTAGEMAGGENGASVAGGGRGGGGRRGLEQDGDERGGGGQDGGRPHDDGQDGGRPREGERGGGRRNSNEQNGDGPRGGEQEGGGRGSGDQDGEQGRAGQDDDGQGGGGWGSRGPLRDANSGFGGAELVARLRARRVLVLLDDFDPVRDECVRLVQSLLLGAPGVRVLAAGRQPLGLGQELVHHLRPLPVVAPGAEKEPGPAVELFMERARGARRQADAAPTPSPPAPDEAELRAVRDICARLEGVPLAVELAAAQTGLHTPAQLARMLRPSQGWLGKPEAPLRRHRSLRAAVGASYALCGQAERSVWARLSIFAGEFDEDAAVYVCAGGGLAPERVAPCLARLVLASVLEPVRDPGGVLQPRYRLPAAARDFGAERLESTGESGTAATRHLAWYRAVAATAHELWSTGRHDRATLLLRDEEPDLRAALERAALDPPPHTADRSTSADITAAGTTALGMVVDLWFWWAVCGHATEGREHLRRLLPLSQADAPRGGQALWLAGWLAACDGAPEAEELLGQAWRVAVLAGDDATIGRVAHVLGLIALRGGETERAIEYLREAAHTVPAHAHHGPSAAVSWAGLAVAQARVRPADALRSVRRASAGTQTRHDIWTRSVTQYALALVEYLRGRRSRAWRRAHKALAGVVSVAGPPGAASVHQLITAIEHGPALGGIEWPPPCGWNPPGT